MRAAATFSRPRRRPHTTDAEEEAADPLHTVVAPHDVAAAQGATAPPSGGAPAPAPPPPTTVDGPAAPAAPPAPAAPSRGIRLSGRTLTIALIVAVVALAGVLAAVLATRGGSSSHTTGNGATSTFNVPLSSAAEVPKSLVSALSGTANVKITGSQVCWRFTLKGVDKPTAAHIHQGGPTVSGPVVVPLGGSFAPSGCTKSTAPVVAAILKDPTGYYVNVHSLKYPDGAVRGQLKTGAGSGSQLHFVGLQGIVPKGIFDRCKVQAKPAAGAIQTAVCARSNGTGQVYYPQQLELSTFGSTADVKRAYEAARRAANIKANFGRCDGTNWLGEGTWFHAPEAPGHPGKPGGTRFCYFDGNTAVIVWTHEKFEQANHVDLLGTARESSADHTDLFNWWRFWTHRIGKCLLVGCTASAR